MIYFIKMEADQKRYTKTELQITVREDAIQ